MQKDMDTIEKKVADAILERKADKIEIGGEVYGIAPPTIATLILVSEVVATLPSVEKEESGQVVQSVLRNARHFRGLGDIAAILILGAKNLSEERVVETEERRLFGLWRRKRKHRIVVDRKAELARKILENVRPSVLFNIVLRRLQDMEVVSFFGVITSLSEANILKPTREVA